LCHGLYSCGLNQAKIGIKALRKNSRYTIATSSESFTGCQKKYSPLHSTKTKFPKYSIRIFSLIAKNILPKKNITPPIEAYAMALVISWMANYLIQEKP